MNNKTLLEVLEASNELIKTQEKTISLLKENIATQKILIAKLTQQLEGVKNLNELKIIHDN